MTENPGLIGNTIGVYQIQRKRRCFDPYTFYFEAIDTTHRETFWLVAYPPTVLKVAGVHTSLESELQQIQTIEHDFLMHPAEVIHDPKENYLFLVYPAFTRSIPLSELGGKLRPAQIRKLFYFLANLLDAAHDHGIYGNFDPRQLYIRRHGDDIDIRWYRTPVRYHSLLPQEIEGTDENEWWSYQSPERSEGLPVTPQSDFFSLGTVLFESITGKRAFFHQLAEQVKQQIISGASKNVEQARLTPGQLDLLTALHQADPQLRLTRSAVFQEKIRELFPDISKFPSEYPQTSEHPALYVSDATNGSDEDDISSSANLDIITDVESVVSHSSSPVIFVEPWRESRTSAAAVPPFAKTPSSTEEPTPVSANTLVQSERENQSLGEYRQPTETSTNANPSETEPHCTAIARSHKVMNLKKMHRLELKLTPPPAQSAAWVEDKTTAWEKPTGSWMQESSPYIRVVPVFPGCLVSPQETVLDVRANTIEAHFWVVPLAPVDISEAATVQLWHGGVLKDEIPLPCQIYSQLPTWIAGIASLCSFLAGFAFQLYGPQGHTAAKGDPSLFSHLFHQTITVFAGYGFWFGFFFLFAAGISYYFLRPQPAAPLTYVLSQSLPSPSP